MVAVNHDGIDLVQVGEAWGTEDWLVSAWDAGQTSTMTFSPENVSTTSDGTVSLSLSASEPGASRPYCGGEIRSMEASSIGTWTWTAQAPEMVDGAVFGLFTYREDHFNDPWLEFDFEFVGADTTKVQLNIHMETADGEHVTLEQANGWEPIIVDLGFDASEGMHTYEIIVTETEAHFLVDGNIVGSFDASDMPYNTWITGDMKGYANLWCVPPELSFWAGEWVDPGTPLTATLLEADVLPGDIGAFMPPPPLTTEIHGDEGANDLIGLADDDIIFGNGSNDKISGMSGDDRLDGGSGDDTLFGEAGADTLIGGLGKDDLYGGRDGNIDTFVFNDIAESGFRKKADVIHDFEVGIDKIDLSGMDVHLGMEGDQAFWFNGTSAGPNSVWVSNGRSETLVRVDVTGDQRPDMEIRLIGNVPLTENDFLL